MAVFAVRGIANLYTMVPHLGQGTWGVISTAALVVRGQRVAWVGPDAKCPPTDLVVDASGQVVLPGLVDSHTHALWYGSRTHELGLRLAGTSYTDILQDGGGILSTVRQTRAASDAQLVAATVARLRAMLARGVTTVEVKSGYGLNPHHEVRCLRLIREAARSANVRVVTTFLGAHAVPPEFLGHADGYVRQVVEQQLPQVVGLADFADVYVDRGAFTLDQGRLVLLAAREAGLKIRIHAEQIQHTGAAAMAAGLGALSADHLEHLDAAGVHALAKAGTVANVLPGAMLYLQQAPPPIAALRKAGVPMAIATDLNPGSSPVHSLWTCATLACLSMGLTVPEALVGITRNGAKALGLTDVGVLRPGAMADFALYKPYMGDPPTAESLIQYLDGPCCEAVYRSGKPA